MNEETLKAIAECIRAKTTDADFHAKLNHESLPLMNTVEFMLLASNIIVWLGRILDNENMEFGLRCLAAGFLYGREFGQAEMADRVVGE